jgi:membrane protein DedA with SNARE-associated domain
MRVNESAMFSFEQVRPWIERGGYGVVFGLLFACGLGLPCPEDIPLTISGYLVAQNHMHLAIVAPLAWLGIISGDCVLYRLGYRYGRNITRAPFIGKHVTLKRLERAEYLFSRWGVWVVAVGRLFAGIRGAMVVAAGTTRFNFIKFIIADGLAAIVSGGLFMLLGWWFGSNVDAMMKRSEEMKHAIIIGGLILATGVALYIWWRIRSHKTVGDAVVEEVEHLTITSSEQQSDSK